MTRVFVDSDVFIAIARLDDSNHTKALKHLNRLIDQQVQFVTSGYVFSEVITVLGMRVGKAAANFFIDTMRSAENPYTILRVDDELEKQSVAIFKAQSSKNVSFVDCTNIALVRKHGLDLIFSFDKIYAKNGLKVVPFGSGAR